MSALLALNCSMYHFIRLLMYVIKDFSALRAVFMTLLACTSRAHTSRRLPYLASSRPSGGSRHNSACLYACLSYYACSKPYPIFLKQVKYS